ncbi:phosphopantetheine adenylyltransferase [Roseibium sp. RKSG952]|uniref:phosphopantetheine adenylyltransferase n=1 Tax=Roseibium sp. RKSG952 TaxID=2529384 RepID=UPI0018AD2B8D|nr:phosphopantetheine adenylyltransferase [Roseibium sp. RKSG952]
MRFEHKAGTSNVTTEARADAKARMQASKFQAFGFIAGALLVSIAVIFTSYQPAFSKIASADVAMAAAVSNMPAPKSGRLASGSSPAACDGQTWGAWSESCAAALSGNKPVRNVRFVTVEKHAKSVNETILARYPVQN